MAVGQLLTDHLHVGQMYVGQMSVDQMVFDEKTSNRSEAGPFLIM